MTCAADMLEADEKKLLEKQVEAVKAADVMPTMTAFHERCMELEIERRILLEQTHKKTVAEVCELRDQVENLTLYLSEIFALNRPMKVVISDRHPGLPGYAPEKGKSADQIRKLANLICCKDCAHLEYEDLGIYYCGLHRITGQLSPDDYCSRSERKERQRDAARD